MSSALVRSVLPMPDLGKLSRQGANRELIAAAVAAGVGAGAWSHDNAYATAGRPAPYLLDGRPVTTGDLFATDPQGERHPLPLLIDARARGLDYVDNPDYLGTIRTMSPSTKASLYCESVAGGAGRDGWGVARNVFVGFDRNGRERIVTAATGDGQCATGKARYPRAPKNRSVSLTTGADIEGAIPEGARRATAADQPGHTVAGYYVTAESDLTPEPSAPARTKRAGNRAGRAARLASRAANNNN